VGDKLRQMLTECTNCDIFL